MRTTAICLTAAALMAGLTTDAFAERTLRVTMQVAAGHPLGRNITLFKDRVEDLSKGEISVEVYDSAQLYKGPDVPQAVSSGAIDMGLVSIDEFSGTLPDTAIFGVAFLFPDFESLAKAASPDSPIRHAVDARIETTGARVAWWLDHGPMNLMAHEAVRLPKDMEGKKIRVQGKTAGDFAEAVGANPVKISGSEQYLAYQRGTVDMGMTGPTAITERKLHEVMDYMVETNHAQIEYLVIMNNGLWNDLSDEEKGWVTEAAQDAEAHLREETVADNTAAVKTIEDDTPMEVIHLTAEELAQWKEASQPAVQAYLDLAGEDGQKLLDLVRAELGN